MLIPVFQLQLVTRVGSVGDPRPPCFVGTGKEPNRGLSAESLCQRLWPRGVLQLASKGPDHDNRGMTKVLFRRRKQALVHRIAEDRFVFRTVSIGGVEPRRFHSRADDIFTDRIAVKECGANFCSQRTAPRRFPNAGGSRNNVQFVGHDKNVRRSPRRDKITPRVENEQSQVAKKEHA